jgi:hypothetical protein
VGHTLEEAVVEENVSSRHHVDVSMKKRPADLASERGDRAWGRVLRIGLLIAVLIHVAILLSSRTSGVMLSPFAAAGPDAGDYRAAAGGGGGMEAVEFRVQRSQPEAVTPIPVPAVEAPVVVEPEPVREPVVEPGPPVALSMPGLGEVSDGGDRGTSTGPGSATGTGQGGGGTEEEGSSAILAPVPRGMILPPADRPRGVRGREVTVWVFVTDQGRVVADSTRLEPPTSDSGYNRRLKRSAAEWSFDPARKSGRAVAAWYPYQIIL